MEQLAFGYTGGDSDVKVPESVSPALHRKSSAEVVLVPDSPSEPKQGRPTEGIDLTKHTEEKDPLDRMNIMIFPWM